MLPYRELDDALGLTDIGADTLADARTGKNGRHRLVGLLRQSVFGRLAGCEDVNDADRLCRDPAMRWVVRDRAISGSAASASQVGRFETKWLSRPENLAALASVRTPASRSSLTSRSCNVLCARSTRPLAWLELAQMMSMFCGGAGFLDSGIS